MDGFFCHLCCNKNHVCCSYCKACTECSSHSIFLAFYYSYYMDGRVNKVEDFLKTRLLDTLTEQITKVTKVLKFCLKSLNFHYSLNILYVQYTLHIRVFPGSECAFWGWLGMKINMIGPHSFRAGRCRLSEKLIIKNVFNFLLVYF